MRFYQQALVVLVGTVTAVQAGKAENLPEHKQEERKLQLNKGVYATSYTAVADFTVPKTCAYVFDDPHVFTFDGFRNDCQGAGDYIQSRSLDSDFEVQARFTPGTEWAIRDWKQRTGWNLGTAVKSAVVRTGHPNEPTIEIDADVTHTGNGVHGCALRYVVNGEEVDLGSDMQIDDNVVFQRRNNWEEDIWNAGKWRERHHRNFFFKDSGVFVQVTKGFWNNYYDCFLNLRICIPDDIKQETLVGVFGNANGNKDDEFKTIWGTTPATKPSSWGQRNDFCKDNYCVPNTAESLFTNPDINAVCEAKIDEALDEMLKNVSDDIKTACRNDEDCIIDAVTTGDLEVGLRTLADKEEKDTPVVPDTPPEPQDEVEDDVCTTAEGTVVPCDIFTENLNCEALDYDYGFKMDGCQSGTATPFSGLELTDQSPTCQVGNYNVGKFDILCSKPDGGSFKDATITPSVDTVIKVKGGTGGTLYTDLKAGETYTLTTGSGTDYKAISHIEFCFKCPSAIEGTELVQCAADVKSCGPGLDVSRDPANNCEFPACPATTAPPPPPATTTATPDDVMTTAAPPGTRGDPHFKTHGGEMYDFHGGCDLVLLDNPNFHNGLGMRVHIRTKIQTWWSYVHTAVLQIGDETLEITGGQNNKQWVLTNGVANEELEEDKWYTTKFAGLNLRLKQKGCNKEAHVYLGNGEKLSIRTYYDFVKVDVKGEGSEHYVGSHGLLGRFPDGLRVGRDGETFLEDVIAFGKEWQVQPDEPKLFSSYKEDWIVPAGQECAMPVETEAKTKLRQRRLANGIPEEAAEKACGHLESEDDRKACIYDVIATQDVGMAAVW